MAVHLGDLTMNCRSCLSGRKIQCEYEVPGQEVWELYGERYRGCPFRIVTRQSANFLRAFQFYKEGYFPNAGSWLDQSAKMLDAFEVIDKELQAIELERERRRNQFKR
ncbi:MAG: hypothetical protein ABII75_09750 [Candidatus Omnitrophota bacterium]